LQDDEYLAALQADREKELKTVQEAELRRAEEAAAREAALERQKKEEEEKLKKQREEEVLQLAGLESWQNMIEIHTFTILG
jgi:leucyl aminopeptidase (aminopeptidase T)